MYEDNKAERDFRMNPPDSAPGQDSNDSGWGDLGMGGDDIFASLDDPLASMSNPSADPWGNPSGGTNQNPNGGNADPWGNPSQPSAPIPPTGTGDTDSALEEKLFEGMALAGKGIVSYCKYLLKSLQNNNESDWHNLGVRVVKVSGGCCIGGMGLLLLKVAMPSIKPYDLIIGSLLSGVVGVGLCMFNDLDPSTSKTKVDPLADMPDPSESSENVDPFPLEEPVEPKEDPLAGMSDDPWACFEEEENPSESDFSDGDSVGDDPWACFEEEEEEWDPSADSYLGGTSIEDVDVDEALNSVPSIQQGTQTRQFLYETFMGVLPRFTPDFADMKEIDSDTDEFYRFEDLVRDAASQVGTKEENLPELLSLYENDFIYRLNCSRPVGLKEQLIAEEVANTFSRDDNNMEIRVGCYATVETSTNMYTINLFKGEPSHNVGRKSSVRISLGDIYDNISDFILDTRNQMPFVWGTNEYGKPIYCDLINNNSLIISGEPRGGKSWKGQSILAQLCMFNSPKEVEFYIFDCKNTASDYRYPAEVLPHIKYFCGDPTKMNDGIERILDKAVKERDSLITSAGCINIKDYNNKFPEKKLSYMYIIIDEMMALMDYFSLNNLKDESNRFKGFLSTMVSKLPYTGVRFILFPHRIVDNVISKNTYSLVSSRAVVCQSNPDDLKSAMNVTSKTFPYKLVSPGDMAIRSKDIGGDVMYCHAEMLTSDNDSNKKLFKFIGSVWQKLEPDCKCIEVNGAVCGKITIDNPNRVVKPPRDNTVSNISYVSEEEPITNESIDDIMDGLEGSISSEEEDFWNNF